MPVSTSPTYQYDEPADAAPALQPGLILLVDDDEDVRFTMSFLLDDEGYEVLQAANGREALDALAVGPLPSLILLDGMMPVMNGRQFREAQLREPRLRSVPVVLVTAGHVDTLVEAIAPNAALSKPIELADLLELVRRFAGPPRPRVVR